MRSDLRVWNVGESVDGSPSSPAQAERLVANPRERRRGLLLGPASRSAYGEGGAEVRGRLERGGVAVTDMVDEWDEMG